jgi:hypothetical protein
MAQISGSARLDFTGIIANPHLMEFTTPELVREGLAVTRDVARDRNLPLLLLAVEQGVATQLPPDPQRPPLLILQRHLLKPWENEDKDKIQ